MSRVCGWGLQFGADAAPMLCETRVCGSRRCLRFSPRNAGGGAWPQQRISELAIKDGAIENGCAPAIPPAWPGPHAACHAGWFLPVLPSPMKAAPWKVRLTVSVLNPSQQNMGHGFRQSDHIMDPYFAGWYAMLLANHGRVRKISGSIRAILFVWPCEEFPPAATVEHRYIFRPGSHRERFLAQFARLQMEPLKCVLARAKADTAVP